MALQAPIWATKRSVFLLQGHSIKLLADTCHQPGAPSFFLQWRAEGLERNPHICLPVPSFRFTQRTDSCRWLAKTEIFLKSLLINVQEPGPCHKRTVSPSKTWCVQGGSWGRKCAHLGKPCRGLTEAVDFGSMPTSQGDAMQSQWTIRCLKDCIPSWPWLLPLLFSGGGKWSARQGLSIIKRNTWGHDLSGDFFGHEGIGFYSRIWQK